MRLTLRISIGTMAAQVSGPWWAIIRNKRKSVILAISHHSFCSQAKGSIIKSPQERRG
jgi:hypothetical protein